MTWTITIENVAGILSGEAELRPGINTVRGSNWQGKTSFIEAIKTALGVSTALTEGKRAGAVRLTTDEETVTVELHRENGVVHRTGEGYLTDDYDLVRTELFACLDDRNEIRRAVRDGTDLESVLLRPLAVQNIEERITELQTERERLDAELSQARKAANRLPRAQERVERLEDEIDALREQRDELPAGSAQSRLSHVRAERDRTQTQISRLEHSIERTEDVVETKRAERNELSIPDTTDFESELADARDRLQTVKRDIEVLQSVYSANQLVLDEHRLELVTEIEHDVVSDQVVCWVCGTDVTRDDLEDRLSALGEKITALRADAETNREAVETLEAEREEVRQARRRKQDLDDSIAELEETLSDRRTSLTDARDRLQDLETRLTAESIDETVDELAAVEGEIKYRETELEEAEEEVATLESRVTQIETLADETASLTAQIESLRTRKADLKQRTRRTFDDAIQDLLDRFDAGFESARLTPEFDLVVAREGREASLDALSEGELELLGFVAALAGYDSFDVDDTVPVLLVDGLGGLADENLHTLIEYLDGRSEYLVFTAYPEHQPFDGQEIDPTAWDIAHNRQATTE